MAKVEDVKNDIAMTHCDIMCFSETFLTSNVHIHQEDLPMQEECASTKASGGKKCRVPGTLVSLLFVCLLSARTTLATPRSPILATK